MNEQFRGTRGTSGFQDRHRERVQPKIPRWVALYKAIGGITLSIHDAHTP
jgi:hypothetical protein